MMRRKIPIWAAAALFAAPAWPQAIEFAPVISKPVSRTVDLPGEIRPFMAVSLHAKVAGYVERVLVDRGSVVKEGDLLAALSAPEMDAQIAEAESRFQAAEADRTQAEAQLAGAEGTADALGAAAKTPGAVAGNDLVQAQKQVEAARALVNSRQRAATAAHAAIDAQKAMQAYLKITAPFAGVVTERFVHPGALVGPADGQPLLTIQQVSHLRVVVPAPEEDAAGIAPGTKVEFSVPAYPRRTYSGVIARVAHALDQNTRTMPVELDALNPDGSLAPGMYASVKWPVRGAAAALWVPRTSVVTTTERSFVILNAGGKARWVDVKKGAAAGDLIEVIGDLHAGDTVVRRATDEIRNGAALEARAK